MLTNMTRQPLQTVGWDKRSTVPPLRAIITLLFAASIATAADDSSKPTKPKKPSIEVIPVTIHPAVLPTPVLKYHLLPTFLESTPGNAVHYYLKAIMQHVQIWTRLCEESFTPGKESDVNNVVAWLNMPLDELPKDRVNKLLGYYEGHWQSTIGELRLAVHQERCEWDMPLRQGNIFDIPLPEVGELRDIARLIALRARLQIAEGKYTEALDSLQIGYGMARHVANQPLLVSNLAGTTIAKVMNDQLLTLCQQPDMPNLYWSIAELPSPFIDRRKAIEAEYDGLYLQYPELQQIRSAKYTPDQWDFALRQFVADIVHYNYQDYSAKKKASDEEQAAEAAKIIAHALEAVPRAKTELLASGHTEKELDAMPPAQIVMLHVLDTYDRLRDEQFKWWNLPYWQATEGLESFEQSLESAKQQELVPVVSLILPAAKGSLLFAFARIDRQLAVLRCIEALRLYAANHDGKLPVALDDIKEVPIPLNPVTGKAFSYHLDGETAVLDTEGASTKGPQFQYRITVAH